MKTRFDKKRCAANIYKLGELVMILKHSRNIGDSNKLLPPYSGPYKISAVLGNDRYEVCSIDGFSSKKYKNVYSADKMKRWIDIGTKYNCQTGSANDSEGSDND
ncbi:unnamed protein product [Diatraea saccharalis]|uniref:Uncharacterized protein n=1 Tax=Diatraea saccharalis TaxID=40085 RepID=A0A9N9R262_9NEOP|nr:unnamed protein product [Diatraea saccharalis]